MTLTQSLLQGFKTQYNKQQLNSALRNLDTSELTAIETIQQSLADTATAYWNLAHQQKLIDLANEALRIAKEEERLIQAKVDQGDLAPIEAVRVKAATLSAQLALVDAKNAYESSKESLLLLLGEQPNQDITIESRHLTWEPSTSMLNTRIPNCKRSMNTIRP